MRILKNLHFWTIIFIYVFALISITSPAYSEDGDTEILVIGSSLITRDNLAEARKLAISDAHIKGIEAYLVKTLGRQGMINNFENIVNEIIPGSGDVIENYDIRAEESNSRYYKLLASIKVNKKLMDEKLRNSGIILYEGTSLRVLFLISDRTSPDEAPFEWWTDPEYNTNLSSSELMLLRLFQERGFDPVNRLTGIPEKGYNPELFKEELSDEDAAEWGKLYSADVVILGKVDAEDFNALTADLKAIESDNASVMASYSRDLIIGNDPENRGMIADIQEKILTDGVTQIIPDILRVFKKEEEKLSYFDIELKGLERLEQVTAFITFLREKISGVVSVLQTRITRGSVTMAVEFSGSNKTFVEKIKGSTEVPFAAEIVIGENGNLTVNAI